MQKFLTFFTHRTFSDMILKRKHTGTVNYAEKNSHFAACPQEEIASFATLTNRIPKGRNMRGLRNTFTGAIKK